MLDIATAPLYNENEQKGKETLRGTPAAFLPAEKSVFFYAKNRARLRRARKKRAAHDFAYPHILRARRGIRYTSPVSCRPGGSVCSEDFHLSDMPPQNGWVFEALSPLWESKYKFLGGSK